VPLEWKDNNGILIAGQSGSGKSQTAALYLNQLAYQGVQLIICDFDSPLEEEEALSERVKHLQGAFYLPPAKSPEEIKQRLAALDTEYRTRLDDPTRRFPLMLVIDEVSAFLSYIKDDEGKSIENFARGLLQMRKVGIRSMIIGQEFSSGFSTQLIRPIRTAFRVKVIHQLDSANTKMLLDMPTTDTIRGIGKQPTGFAYYNERFMAVPLLNEEAKKKAVRRIREFNPLPVLDNPPVVELGDPEISTTETYDNGYANAGFNNPTTKDLVLFWYRRNHSKYEIINRLVKGRAETLSKIYDEIVDKEIGK
jgi:hypothetical protein